ncbi:MAG TPA: hypothetical protein VGL56_16325 [Fimbriimonadaceae bacterium]|jgi:hypothetical protein
MDSQPDFEGIVTIREGMFHRVGFRPDFFYKGATKVGWLIWPQQVLDLEGQVLPEGTPYPRTALVRLIILSEEFKPMHRERLRPGVEFTLNEGSHIIMDGVVTKVFDSLTHP